MTEVYNVLVVAEFNGINEEKKAEIHERLEEQGFERVPTLLSTSAWEIKCEGRDESEAKDKAIQIIHNVCRTYPFELRMLVQCGKGLVIRRKKQFEP